MRIILRRKKNIENVCTSPEGASGEATEHRSNQASRASCTYRKITISSQRRKSRLQSINTSVGMQIKPLTFNLIPVTQKKDEFILIVSIKKNKYPNKDDRKIAIN
jgi:hypothetical protein